MQVEETYEDLKFSEGNTYPAPREFKDLKFNGTQITFFSGADSVTAEAFALLLDSISQSGVWTYTLLVNALGGTGTFSDPFVGLETSISAGDILSLGAPCISNPFVSEFASKPEFGGWIVDSYTNTSVTFRATSDATFGPGPPIEAFGFSSNNLPAQAVAWALGSANEESGSSASVLGPATCSEIAGQR